jgi:exodeoxyribonuclease VII large subunit
MNSIYTVTQINRYISFRLKEDQVLSGLMIKGEISGFVHHRSGHFYFTLKDEQTQIKAVMFRNFSSRLAFEPENGMSVIVMGSVQVYEASGQYQVYVTDIQPDGIGAAYLATEQLKARLAEEGLFDAALKKPIPDFPARIGVITSKTGAALQDILNIIGRRCPLVEVTVFGCLVQGEYAPDSICEALLQADLYGCDVLICGRGGGSYEDLMAFNSEKVARTAAGLVTPLISAVGHETDTTIIDFVADLRAPTPSAAAELAVPDMEHIKENLRNMGLALDGAAAGLLQRKREALRRYADTLERLRPEAKLRAVQGSISLMKERLEGAMQQYIRICENRVAAAAMRLELLDPMKIMSSGYSLVYRGEALVKSTKQLHEGDNVRIMLSDGYADAVIERTGK